MKIQDRQFSNNDFDWSDLIESTWHFTAKTATFDSLPGKKALTQLLQTVMFYLFDRVASLIISGRSNVTVTNIDDQGSSNSVK